MALVIRDRMQLLGLLLAGAVCLHLASPASSGIEWTSGAVAATAIEADDASAPTPSPAPMPEHGPLHVASVHVAIVVILGAMLLRQMMFSSRGGLAGQRGITTASRPQFPVLEHVTDSDLSVTSGVCLRV